MIMGHIFKALIAVNCWKFQGTLNRRSDSWDASGKMSKAVWGQRGCHIPRARGRGEQSTALPCPTNLECRADTDSTVWVVCFTNTGWVTGSSHVQRPETECFPLEHSVRLAYSLVCISVSQKRKFRNDFMWY